MRPAAYVRLSALPLNTNGKIDRTRLPEPDWSRPSRTPQQLTDQVELRMARLFHEVLGDLEIAADEDFFMLGGDSVRAMQLRRRICEEFGSELPLAPCSTHPPCAAWPPRFRRAIRQDPALRSARPRPRM